MAGLIFFFQFSGQLAFEVDLIDGGSREKLKVPANTLYYIPVKSG